jgi:protein O-GlcNAc transferase
MPLSTTTDLLQEALALHRRGALTEAAARYREVLRVDPKNADAYYFLGMMTCQADHFDEGADFARKALACDPCHPNAHILLGRALSALGWHDEAIKSLQQATVLAPDLASAHSHLADVLSDLGHKAEAIQSYDRALALAPDCVEDWFNRGLALNAVGWRENALDSFERAIAVKPELALAHLERANVLWRLHRYDEALESTGNAITRDSGLAEAWHSRGNILYDLGQYDDAFAAYGKALSIKPDLADAWSSRGNVLSRFIRFDEAFAAYDKALALKPDSVEAWLGRGNVYTGLKQYDNALAAYDKALAFKPNLAEAWLGRGNIYTGLKQYDNAFAAYDRALSLRPDLEYAEGARIHAKMILCDWAKIEEESLRVLSAVREQKLVTSPFTLLSIPSSAADQLQSARIFAADQGSFPALWRGKIYSHDRIRVAYISGDFRNHAVAHLTAGLFEHHDRSRFEITGISIGSGDDTPLRRRLESAFDHFIDAKDKTDADIASLIGDREIDIAIDLMGHTQSSRPGILARRPSPIQVHYLGYAGTLGTDYIDYLLADSTVVPEEHRRFFAEHVVWLPDCFLVSDNRRSISPHTPTRHECGLPEREFVFCSFNNSYKIAPTTFAVWMRLLRATPKSVLWLSQPDAIAIANLHREAEQHRVSSQRLIFAPKVADNAEHLARQRQADLFLDTLPYNAHTTASDALWAGLPVLTCLGETFAGRVAASLLRSIGVPELVTASPQEYEALALKLAHEPALLAGIKAQLARNRETFPLFDTARFARHVETAYVTMWQRYQRRETPEAFAVAPIK